MNFKIYIIGNKIERFYIEAINEYKKRLSRYCKIELAYIKNEKQLHKKLSDKLYKIFVSTKERQISSVELANKINDLGISGKSDIAIIIGAENILSVVRDEVLAISEMEMDLGLNATIVFEQIYRSYRILNNQPYHK